MVTHIILLINYKDTKSHDKPDETLKAEKDVEKSSSTMELQNKQQIRHQESLNFEDVTVDMYRDALLHKKKLSVPDESDESSRQETR